MQDILYSKIIYEDLKDLDADLYKGLISLGIHEKDDVEDQFGLYFNAAEEVWG